VKTTKRGLLVTFLLVPCGRWTRFTLLNTGMTRDGLFLIENGEITGPVQNFRWNMSPLGRLLRTSRRSARRCRFTPAKPTTAPGTALVPPIRVEDF